MKTLLYVLFLCLCLNNTSFAQQWEYEDVPVVIANLLYSMGISDIDEASNGDIFCIPFDGETLWLARKHNGVWSEISNPFNPNNSSTYENQCLYDNQSRLWLSDGIASLFWLENQNWQQENFTNSLDSLVR